ncbi:NAD(P)-binding protein [Lindgomyces ingoldianus]|uniref:NAD(P)-binding protein n=1 Tax=Lindgomyces ingoldianus TaxID=673940 RepID=A0ACB6QPV1_9PLEO|nr:NAD(P)-binding protein [Lindgomyces ingoldianus]KAF2468931.1 NAD(P)-binding protein [Lindgomyces ingoldianus]
MKDLKGKTALITGGGTGIGLALALQLAAEGTNIVICSTNKERLSAGANEIRKSASNVKVLDIICDVSDRSSVKTLKAEITKAGLQVDILVCNSGVTTGGEFHLHREQDWDWVYGVVLNGTTYCIQEFYPDMVNRGYGHICIHGSQAGMVPNWVTLHGPYTSAKAAVHALGAALRPEAAQHGVGISTIIIAGTQTEIMKSERSRPERFGDSLVVDLKKREARRIPPADVASQVVDGIKQDKGWVATHPDLKARTKQYFDEILAAYDHE